MITYSISYNVVYIAARGSSIIQARGPSHSRPWGTRRGASRGHRHSRGSRGRRPWVYPGTEGRRPVRGPGETGVLRPWDQPTPRLPRAQPEVPVPRQPLLRLRKLQKIGVPKCSNEVFKRENLIIVVVGFKFNYVFWALKIT